MDNKSIFTLNVEDDPLNKQRLENTRLNEKLKNLTELIDINENKIRDLTNQSDRYEKMIKEKSNRTTNLQEEIENLRLHLGKLERELEGRITSEESKTLKTNND